MWRVSPHGTYVAYTTTLGGADSQTYRIRRVSDGHDLPEVITGAKYWYPTWDGETAFYWEGYRLGPDGSTIGPYRIFHHRLFTRPAADTLVYEPPAGKSWYSAITFTLDHRYAIVATGSESGYGKLWRPANAPVAAPFKTLFPFTNASYDIFANEGPKLYVLTTDGAPNGRIVWVDIRDPRHIMHTIIPQSSVVIDAARIVGDRIYVSLVRDVQSEIRITTKDGASLGFVPLPQRGTVSLEGSDKAHRSLEFGFTSFTQPGLELAYDSRTHLLHVLTRTKVPFDPSDIVVDQAFARSEDGTRIPYFLVHRRRMRHDGLTPTILYGYGGFGLRTTSMPAFNQLCAIWVANGGAYALANVRGGGEYGEAWHRAAMLTNKQRSFDDFAAVARALHETGVSDRDHLGIYGISGGGLLVAAAETEHPELYGAVVAQSGLYDMLRYQYYGTERTWQPEDGTSDHSEAEFRALAAYSPYHNVREGTAYPATLILTGDADDRVSPAHAYKFAAALQHAQASPAPILLDVIAGSGHNDARRNTTAQRLTDIIGFFSTNLGMDW
jgi:prolyl oligopeptidase